jgi:peptide deformylase
MTTRTFVRVLYAVLIVFVMDKTDTPSRENSMSFLSPDNPALNRSSVAVSPAELRSAEIQSLIARMAIFSSGKQKTQTRTLVGLAAPQVGFLKRIIFVDTGADGKGKVTGVRAYINPVIVWKSAETSEWYEGCFSTGNVTGIVERSDRIRISALDAGGNQINEEHTGYPARIFQHEIDHLDGIRFPDRINDENKLHWVESEEFPQYRNAEAWRTWERKYARAEWEAVKMGVSRP